MTDIDVARYGRRIVGAGMMFLLLIVGSCASFGIMEKLDADEIMVVQDPLDGELHWYTSPGLKPQWWGRTVTYKKRSTYEFKAPVTFNDGGKGEIHGSVMFELPLDDKNLTEIHTKYGSDIAIQKLMETVTNKVIYMTGPTMSSRESYAEKKNYLISYAQDQIDHGVYRTRQAAQEQVDQFTGQKRVTMIAEIVMEKGVPARQEQSVVGEFGIRAFNFAISMIDYDDAVEKQIRDQQQITMDVQTSIAEAVKAQQKAITVEQQGRASAAEARWKQEVLKATAVTQAEQQLAVQQMGVKTADAYKQEQLLRADADSTYKKRMLEADGALAPKLATFEKVNAMWAEAFKAHPGQLVPSVVMGGQGNGNGNGASTAQSFMDMMMIKTAKDLAVDLRPSGKQ